MRISINRFLLIVLLFSVSITGKGQCNNAISSFPFTEDFESNNGGWVAGGTGAQWHWGKPQKQVINTAASGINCWGVGVGEPTGPYSSGISWVQSPCFNFSSSQYPLVSFNVFWDSEGQYDGTSFQYSINNGSSWQTLGSNSDMDCFNINWFNSSPNKLTEASYGWSGSTQSSSGSCGGGGGSNKWVLAQHTIAMLAGKPNVIFRFVFGAGTVCNDYDGFAFDDFHIEEAPANVASFTYACKGVNTIGFTNTSKFCPKKFAWNFGDPASEDNNISTQKNPQHTFSAPGKYTVTFTVSSDANAPSTFSDEVTINDVNVKTTNTTCKLSNGSIEVSPISGQPPFQYSWQPTVSSSATAVNIKSGNYIIIVTDNEGCGIKKNIQLSNTGNPTPVILQKNISLCPGQNILLSAGKGFKNYLWQDGSTGETYLAKAPGTYSVEVMNEIGCGSFGFTTINTTINCNDIFFPSSFTPDGNGLNEMFGPIGDLYSVSNYKLIIYNRWGQEVFKSSDPFEKWRGTINSQKSNGNTFVWYVTYDYKGVERRTQKGTVTIIH